MGDLRRTLELKTESENGPALELDDWDHRDYIEDVLAEHFDLDYQYVVEEEESGRYILYFCESVKTSVLESAIEAINNHHASSAELYKVV